MENDLRNFIINYANADFEKIKFIGNSGSSQDKADLNGKYRLEVCEYLCNNFRLAPDSLIVDLFLELAKSAKADYTIYKNYHLFASELLNRGGVAFFEYYLEGVSVRRIPV